MSSYNTLKLNKKIKNNKIFQFLDLWLTGGCDHESVVFINQKSNLSSKAERIPKKKKLN